MTLREIQRLVRRYVISLVLDALARSDASALEQLRSWSQQTVQALRLTRRA